MKKEDEEHENDFCTLFFYNGRLLDAIAGKEGEGLRRDRLAADHDGDGRRAGDRRCGADAAHGLGGRDHLLRCKDSFPDGEAAGLCLERPGQCRESGMTNGQSGDAAKAAGFEVNTSVLQAVEGNGKLSSIRFTDGSTLAVDGLFIALGTADSTDMARKLGAELNGRFIRIDGDGATNIPGLFAAGDCTGGLMQVAKAVHEGARAGLTALKFLRQHKTEET